ncbi:hypothetical protein GCM10028796_13310 [Ramlibacter monticola]|uniref:Uncharacterized protein n=1 Tax=Ramlibacter monticola TaxID=1926872 RepID=A0A936YU69_9BURK|nr:hypothetical protein [Ramlibacter monticola]MBL0390174.1 hypothetical protein [Ramlibacter monticola]
MAHRLARTLWPAFIAACALELLVFAFVDPLQLQWASGEPAAGWTRQAVYSAAFFAFWGVCLGACVLTRLLGRTPAELNAVA